MICPVHQFIECLEKCRIYQTKHLVDRYQEFFKIDVSNFFYDLEYITLYECKITGYRFFYPFTIQGNSKFYSLLSEVNKNYYQHENYSLYLKKYIMEKTIIDVACGDGFFLNSVKSFVKKGIGFDINQENIQKDNIIFVQQNFDDFFRFNKEKYDVLTAFHFLEHIWEVRKFFMVIRENLYDNGLLVLGLPDSSQKFLQDDILNFPPHHMGWWSKSSLKKVASYFGFGFVDTFYVSADKLNIDKKAFWIKNSYPMFFNNIISKFYYKIGMILPKLFLGNTFISVFKKCDYENN